MLSPTLGIPLAVARFMKHLTTNDHRRILNHPVEPGFDATWAGEGGSWNGDENKECINESHAFLDGNFSREHRKTQLTLSHGRGRLRPIRSGRGVAERSQHAPCPRPGYMNNVHGVAVDVQTRRVFVNDRAVGEGQVTN